MKSPYIKKLRVPVYRNVLWVIVSNNLTSAIDYMEDLTDENIHMQDKHYQAYTYAGITEKGTPRIMLFLTPKSPLDLVCHEVKHVVNLVFAYNGVRLSLSNDEHECYYLQEVLKMVLEVLRKHQPSKKAPKTSKEEEIYPDKTLYIRHPFSKFTA